MKFGRGVLAVLVLGGWSFPAQAAEAPREMVVQATAEVRGENDSAALHLGVVTEDAAAARAVARNNESTEALLARLKNFNYGNLTLATRDFRIEIRRDYSERGAGKLLGYQVVNTIVAEVEGDARPALADKVANLIAAAVGQGANLVNQVRFYIQDPAPLENQALAAAVRKAMAQARTLAQAAGLKPGKIQWMKTMPLDQPVMQERAFMAAKAADAPPLESGSSRVRATVTLGMAMD